MTFSKKVKDARAKARYTAKHNATNLEWTLLSQHNLDNVSGHSETF